MATSSSSSLLHTFGLILFVLVGRFVLGAAGPGVDPDGPRMILAAERITETRTYEASRLPGYPVPELLYAVLFPLFNRQAACYSAVNALLFTAALLCLLQLLKSRQVKHPYLIVFAFSLIPDVFINTANVMDYGYGLSFTLVSISFLNQRRPVAGGIMAGLACGSRLTYAAMLVPLAVLYWGFHERQTLKVRAREISRFCLATIAVGAICWSPVLLKYGSAFLHYTDPFGNRVDGLGRHAVQAFGLTGLLVAVVMVTRLMYLCLAGGRLDGGKKCYVWSFCLMTGLYLAAYFMLPHESAYLLPLTIPVVLIVAFFTSDKLQRTCCVLLLVASVGYSPSDGRLTNAMIDNYRARAHQGALVRFVLDRAEGLPGRKVVVVAGLLPFVEFYEPEAVRDAAAMRELVLRYDLSHEDYESFHRAGMDIYLLNHRIAESIRRNHHYNPLELGAELLVH